MTQTIGFGGGCHWCTEAVFEAIAGVTQVEQGWITSVPPDEAGLKPCVCSSTRPPSTYAP